jgi:hypothetical protein
MIIKVGSMVSHSGALDWGTGKVLEVTATLAMIQFSDGTSRKIAVSHFNTLEPAAPASFSPPAAAVPAAKPARAPRVTKKKK